MLRNGLEPWHLLIVAIVIIVLFGSKKLPDTARALGKSMRILKSETKAMKDDDGTRSDAAQPGTVRSDAAPAEDAPRLIRSAPGDTATARPATEGRPAH
ncbi:Sec-independent protein translocase subunit TatA [Streptomyces shenzhenensis]|uniref:Sec-independent protein translocase protein TatA n=1 Tax=Streptomyces shenzhenensis TaxID=943815 RepID=A0A3M0IBP0_9ACTN|nr:Sec-independent protein translocase subunit TatA [Streptomyces shenzhenensis]RMB85470.1 twin-arginine translocase TatA/TatE family subunit [Streptomyces shenzhenensis]